MATQTRTSTSTWLLPVIVVSIVVAIIVGAIILSNSGDDDAAPEPPPATSGSNDAPTEVQGPSGDRFYAAELRDETDVQALGPVDAPITLVVFSDYQCGFCALWTEQTLPVMMEYVEAGDMRIEWRDVNVFGEDSERGASAAHAAGLQGAFWEYHDALFANGSHESGAVLAEDRLISLAGDLGLDVEQFTADLTSAETQEYVDSYADLGIALGAYSTPSFIVGGEPIVGAQPTEVFVDAVDRALTAAE